MPSTPFKWFIISLFIYTGLMRSYGQDHANFIHLPSTHNGQTISPFTIVESDIGYMYLAQQAGVYVYDGYDYSWIAIGDIFSNLADDDVLKDVLLDDKKNIWFLSEHGRLARRMVSGQFEDVMLRSKNNLNTMHYLNETLWFGSKAGTILRMHNSKLDSVTTLPNFNPDLVEIKSIVADKSNEIYISTTNGNIFSYSQSTARIQELQGLFSNYPGALILQFDTRGILWIGTENFGLFAYNPQTDNYVQHDILSGNSYNLTREMILNLFCDKGGHLWAGTDGGGLYKIDAETREVTQFKYRASNHFSLSSNTVLEVKEDHTGNIWVLTNNDGIDILPNNAMAISYHEGSDHRSPLRILSIFKASDNNLWVGTDGNGLTRITFKDDGSTLEKQFLDDTEQDRGLYVQSIAEDNNMNIWFGTYKNGLWQYEYKSQSFKRIPIKNAEMQVATDVRTVLTDARGRIWVASNLSLNVYSSRRELLATFENNTHGLKGSIAESIFEDTFGNLWFGYSDGGLFKFDENGENLQSSKFKRFSTFNHLNKTYEVKGVSSIVENEPGSLLLIDSRRKLLRFNIDEGTFDEFDHIAALENTMLRGILVQDTKTIWLSSSNGLLQVNLENAKVNSYFKADGLQDNVFLSRSSHRDKEGLLYFGGVMGFNYFAPQEIQSKRSDARLHIKEIQVLNRSARALLPGQVSFGNAINSLQLAYDQASFSFRFSAVDNILNTNYHYAYRLKGFNTSWIPAASERIATYTNIPSGKYVFEVKAGPKDGVYDIAPKSIRISIAPAWWKSSIAYLCYFLGLCLIGYGLFRWSSLRKKLFLEKVKHKKDVEMHGLKMDFFTKMSHEIQTPITLILGPIDQMREMARDNGNLLLHQRLNIIANNARRLSKIAIDLTTVRDRETGRLKLTVTNNNLCEHLQDIAIAFQELARVKHIDFEVHCPNNLSSVWYDRQKLEHILYNMVANAFKFTPSEGNIEVSVAPVDSKKSLRITIVDSGEGIAEEELKDIFKLFYRSPNIIKTTGTGIGLALTKELVDLHKGRLEVRSSLKQGTTFSVTLPVVKSAYSSFEIVEGDVAEPIKVAPNISKKSASKSTTEMKKTILVVEDNFELQNFLKELLSETYHVIVADNGLEGFECAKTNLPDVILSDVMMPVVDGVEMCTLLRDNSITRHIPVMMLTAKNSRDFKLSSLQKGAIEYLNKPFDTNELLLKIENIISSKEKIITRYKQEVINTPEVSLNRSQDDIFLETLVKAIDKNIDDPNFKLEALACDLHISYSSLYRKCQALTGKSLVDFVRLLRLKKAAVVIAKYGYSVSDTAYMVGFNDSKYFSKCFKKQFGRSPNIFKREALQIGAGDYLTKHDIHNVV